MREEMTNDAAENATRRRKTCTIAKNKWPPLVYNTSSGFCDSAEKRVLDARHILWPVLRTAKPSLFFASVGTVGTRIAVGFV